MTQRILNYRFDLNDFLITLHMGLGQEWGTRGRLDGLGPVHGGQSPEEDCYEVVEKS